jgi:hypothetical protein
VFSVNIMILDIPTTATPVIPHDAVKSIVENIRLSRFPKLRTTVVASESELDQDIQNQTKKDGATDQIKSVNFYNATHVVFPQWVSSIIIAGLVTGFLL